MRIPWVVQNGRPQQRLALTAVLLWIYIQTDRPVVCKSLPTEQAYPVNACQSNPCANGGACVPGTGQPWPPVVAGEGLSSLGYRCQCLHGWTGLNCTENVDDCVSQPCLNGGVCEDLPNSRYWCHCQPGFVGINCEHADPCRSSPCENMGRCRANRLGEFTCDCLTWYAGQRCEQELDPCYPTSACRGPGATCQPVHAESATASSSAGGSNPISAGHRLVVDFQCFCGPGYTGRYCDQAESDQCAHHNCLNNATCANEGNHFTCLCQTGFDGKRCENDYRLIVGAQFDLPPLSNGDDPARINTEAPSHLCDILNCSTAQPGDGLCQAACLRHGCLTASELPDCYDWSGCLKVTGGKSNSESPETCVERFGDGHCDKICNRAACFSDGFDCHAVNQGEPQACPSSCLAKDYADSVCQSTPCASMACGYDGGDCQTPVVQVEVNKSVFQAPENTEGKRSAMYWFFIAVLSTGANDPPAVRDQQIRQFLSRLGRLLRTSVRLAVDSLGRNELVVRTPRSGGDQIILAVARSYLGTPCGTNCSRTTDQRPWEKLNTIKQLAGFIRTALATPNYRSPVPVKVFIPLTDVAQLEAFAEVMGQSSRGPLDAAGSRAAIAAYICLGLLAGILLILFPILKRDPWRRLVKRVRTSGIWYPPVPMTYKPGVLGEAPPGFTASGSCMSTVTLTKPAMLGQEDALSPPTGSQKQPLLASLDEQAAAVFGGLSGQHQKRKRHEAFDTKVESALDQELAHRPEATWTLSRSGNHKAEADRCSPIPTKRHFFDQGTCYCPATPSSTKLIAPLRRDGAVEESLERPVPYDPPHRLLDSKDGLHPLSAHEMGQFSRSLAAQQTPSSCDAEVPTADETLYHVAGRMNSGPEVVIAIASKMHSSAGQLNNKAALFLLDSNGRTPASAAAAANALETLGALHQVEREAVVKGSATMTGPQQLQGKTGLPTSRPSGRRRQRVMECRQTTPLMAALQGCNDEALNQLLDEAYPLHGVDEIGRNVVHWAAATNASLACLNRLAQCKGFYRLLNARDDRDRTPLLLAVREGYAEVVRFLLDHKALCQPLSTEAGQTGCFTVEDDPLRMAQDRGHVEIQAMLMEYYRQNGLDILSDSRALGQTASSKSSTYKVDDEEDGSNNGDEDGDDAGEKEQPVEFEDDVEDEDGRAGGDFDPSPGEDRSTPGKVHGAVERAGPPLFYSRNSGRHTEAVDTVDNMEVNHNSGYPLVIPMPFKSAGLASPKFSELHRPSPSGVALNHLATPTHLQFPSEAVFPQYHHHYHPRSAVFSSHSLILPNGILSNDYPCLGESGIKYGAMRRTIHPPASFSTAAAVSLHVPQGGGQAGEPANKLLNGRLHENGSQLI